MTDTKKRFRRYAGFILSALCSSGAYATITVSSPVTGSVVNPPVSMKAQVDNCLGASPTYIGYSVDASTTIIPGSTKTNIDFDDPNVALGPHAIHFKAWSSAGECPTVNVAITVEPGAGITVTAPLNGSTVSLPIPIQATVSTCGGNSATALGYSVDSSATTKFSSALLINTKDSSIPLGTHTLKFKAWSKSILCPVVERTITVTDGLPAPTIPSNAVHDAHREQLGSWKGSFDEGTQNTLKTASASGSDALVSTPQRDGKSRQYQMSFANAGGERFSASWPTSPNATHFVYDNWVYIADASHLANLEMDLNQVLSNGDVVIYAMQCSGYAKVWEYSFNTGTVAKPTVKWQHSNLYCDPQDAKQWAPKTWHHVQLVYSRDAAGIVTYQTVYLDGVEGDLQNAVGNSRFALSWGPLFVTNFQMDGLGASGSVTAYTDGMSVYHW